MFYENQNVYELTSSNFNYFLRNITNNPYQLRVYHVKQGIKRSGGEYAGLEYSRRASRLGSRALEKLPCC